VLQGQHTSLPLAGSDVTLQLASHPVGHDVSQGCKARSSTVKSYWRSLLLSLAVGARLIDKAWCCAVAAAQSGPVLSDLQESGHLRNRRLQKRTDNTNSTHCIRREVTLDSRALYTCSTGRAHRVCLRCCCNLLQLHCTSSAYGTLHVHIMHHAVCDAEGLCPNCCLFTSPDVAA
jgi:hypothetical protein